jgi:hypothetical protein
VDCKSRCGFNFLIFFSWYPTGTFARVSWERKLQNDARNFGKTEHFAGFYALEA